ncbi:MAG: sugar phosphate nucleotidyltransferase [Bacteroidia bacterium]|nr:sugar phosphate nucleotidyltransferase [Bacteroidia bacterium]
MKAVIPVAGIGTKLRPHTHTQPKPLIPVAGKPILGHIIENLLDAGVRHQVFIVGYLREKIQEYVETHYSGKIEMEFVVQEPRLGLAHAIWTARECIKNNREILVLLGDTIFGDDTRHIIEAEGGMLAVHQVDDPREFGIAMLDEAQYVKKLSEKPKIPTSNLALVGLYKITHIPILLEVLGEMMRSEVKESEEYSLTDALMHMINRGVKFRTYRVDNWFDCGRKQSLLHTNRILLERMQEQPKFTHHNSVIIPPVFISEGCEISNSIIGPYAAIAENAQIANSIVRNSILGAYSRLDSIILNNSVVGNDTTLKGKANSINIGDNTEIDFDE